MATGGGYAKLNWNACRVETSAYPSAGAVYLQNIPVGVMINVEVWNANYAYKFTVPPHCVGTSAQSQTGSGPTQTPPPPPPSLPSSGSTISPGSSGGSISSAGQASVNPITGPGESPPPDACAPAMAMRTDGDALGFETDEHLKMPLTGVFSSVRVSARQMARIQAGFNSEVPVAGAAVYVRNPVISVTKTKDQGFVRVAKLGTGDGSTVFHPADVNEFGLRGDGKHPLGKWPARISRNSFMAMAAKRNNEATGDNVNQVFAAGLPTARSWKPRSGAYWGILDLDSLAFRIQHTDSLAADVTDPDPIYVNGHPLYPEGPRWEKISYLYGNLADPGTTLTIEAFSKEADHEILAVIIEVDTTFAGMATLQFEVGVAGDADKYASAYEVIASGAIAGDRQYSPQAVPDLLNDPATAIQLTVIGADALDNLSAGAVTIWLKTQKRVAP